MVIQIYPVLLLPWSGKETESARVKYREIIADNLSKAGWSWGCVSAIDSNGRTIWIVDAHRGDGKRFVVRADEELTAFVELEATTWTHSLGRTYE
jgi:hypothetical protein